MYYAVYSKNTLNCISKVLYTVLHSTNTAHDCIILHYSAIYRHSIYMREHFMGHYIGIEMEGMP